MAWTSTTTSRVENPDQVYLVCLCLSTTVSVKKDELFWVENHKVVLAKISILSLVVFVLSIIEWHNYI